jgi:hypothetical protein
MISRAACFRSVVVICLLAISLAGQQLENPSAVSLRVDPAHLELRVGRAHKFSAEAQGLPAAATVVWLLKEKRGASITPDGVFTATKPGVYHIVAIATVAGTVLKHATAKITVLQQYDVPATVAEIIFAGRNPGTFVGRIVPVSALG